MTHFLQTPDGKLISTHYYSIGLLMPTAAKRFRALQAWRSSSLRGLRVSAADWPLPPGCPPGLPLPRSTGLQARSTSPSSLPARPGPTEPSSPGCPSRAFRAWRPPLAGRRSGPGPPRSLPGRERGGNRPEAARARGPIPRGPPGPGGDSRARGG